MIEFSSKEKIEAMFALGVFYCAYDDNKYDYDRIKQKIEKLDVVVLEKKKSVDFLFQKNIKYVYILIV